MRGWSMNRKRKLVGTIVTFIQICIVATIAAVSHGGAGAGATGSIDITGTVTGPSGSGIASASVYATDPGGSTVDYGPVETANGSNGSTLGAYDLPISVAGTYDIHFIPPNGSG